MRVKTHKERFKQKKEKKKKKRGGYCWVLSPNSMVQKILALIIIFLLIEVRAYYLDLKTKDDF